MSKSRSAAPEGSPTHTPKIRIIGVQSASPRYAALVDQYRARLDAFHERHQQQVKLSGNNQYTAKVSWPGARAIYQNNNGQETVTMIVDPVEEGGEQQSPVETAWDFALIDFFFAGIGDKAPVRLAAFMAHPQTTAQKAMTGDTRMPVQGVSALDWNGSEKPILEFGDFTVVDAPIVATLDDTNDMTRSLRVDLRRFPFQEIEIDLYGISFWTDAVSFTATAVCARGGNPWTGLTHAVNPANSQSDSYIFVVPKQYPDRPNMGDIGEGSVPIIIGTDPITFADMPSQFFGYAKFGSLRIDTRSGKVRFKAA